MTAILTTKLKGNDNDLTMSMITMLIMKIIITMTMTAYQVRGNNENECLPGTIYDDNYYDCFVYQVQVQDEEGELCG